MRFFLYKSKILYGLLIVAIILTCKDMSKTDKTSVVEIDFSATTSQPNPASSDDTISVFHLAISAMFSPQETFHYYEELIHYISRKLKRPVKIDQYKTYKEVNDRLENKQIDAAFICSGAFAEAKNKFPIEILAIPVIQGKTTYNAYIIVHSSSPVKRFEDLRGKSFAFTDPLSNSGRLYAVKRVHDFNSTPEAFFSETIYTHAHDYSIQAVAHQIVDGATVDGLIFNYLKEKYPEKVKDVRVLEISEDYGMPPVVTHGDADPTLKNKLRKIFLEMHTDPEGLEILKQLSIDRFVPGNDNDYLSIQQNLNFVYK